MSIPEIRQRFKEFIGNEKYVHFVLTLYESFPLRDKLFFWQEQLLSDFSNSFDFEPIGIDEIYDVFDQCPVHNCTLKNDTVPIVDGNGIVSKGISKDLSPLANTNAPRDLERFRYGKVIDVLYCPKCRQKNNDE